MFKPVSHDSESQRLNFDYCLLGRVRVGHDAGQFADLGYPAFVLLCSTSMVNISVLTVADG